MKLKIFFISISPYFLIQRLGEVVGDFERQILVQYHVQLHQRPLTQMVDHHVIQCPDAGIVLDGNPQNPWDLLLLSPLAHNHRDGGEHVGKPGDGDECAEEKYLKIDKIKKLNFNFY